MKNKKLLIILGLLLLAVIGVLIAYAFNLKENQPPLPPQPPIKTETPSVNNQIEETNDQKLARIEKLKREMNGISNDSFTVEALTEEEEDCSNEESIKYEEQITTGKAIVAEGIITEISSSSLKVNFKQISINWVSVVSFDKDSLFQALGADSTLIPASISDLKVGDKITVKTKGDNITDDNFVAERILKMN